MPVSKKRKKQKKPKKPKTLKQVLKPISLPSSEQKMSDVILDLSEPLREEEYESEKPTMLLKMLEGLGLNKELKLINRPSSEQKISDAILNLSEPLREEHHTFEQTDNIIGLTIIAWNISLLSDPEKQKKSLQSFLDTYGAWEKENGEKIDSSVSEIISYLIEDKQKMFPDNKDFIMNYKLSETATKIHLSVITTYDRERD